MRCTDISFHGEMEVDLGGVSIRILQVPSAHSDDSTIVYVRESGELFVGDAAYDEYFNGIRDEEKWNSFLKTVHELNSRLIVTGHMLPVTEEQLVAEEML